MIIRITMTDINIISIDAMNHNIIVVIVTMDYVNSYSTILQYQYHSNSIGIVSSINITIIVTILIVLSLIAGVQPRYYQYSS